MALRSSFAVAAVVVVIASTACPPTTSPPVNDTTGEGVVLPNGKTFTRAALLASIADCVVSQQDAFVLDARALLTATTTAATDTTTKPAAQQAFKIAMERWQHLEPMQIGPAAPSTVVAGQNLRDDIYSWPTTSRCAVDDIIVSKAYEQSTFARQLITTRGLDALEALLFVDDDSSSCAATNAIIQGGTWAALSSEERAQRRADYAVVVARLIVTKAEALQKAWASDGDNFIGEVKTAGDGSRFFSRDSLALNAISDAIFYIEHGTKDRKVAAPAGLTRCEATTCPELLESSLSAMSKANVRSNIVGFQQVFGGCSSVDEDIGFDDWLIAVGSPEVASKLNDDIVLALAAVDAIEEADLLQALQNDLASVEALHASIKEITDLMRTQLVSVLDLEIPKRIEGDND